MPAEDVAQDGAEVAAEVRDQVLDLRIAAHPPGDRGPFEADRLVQPGLERRIEEAIRLERAAIAGHVRPDRGVEDLIADLGGNVRAVLRDVLCGHLDPQLRRVADEMLDQEPA